MYRKKKKKKKTQNTNDTELHKTITNIYKAFDKYIDQYTDT